MKFRHRLLAAAAVLGAAALTAQVPAAQAAPVPAAAPTPCVVKGFSPRSVVIGLSTKKVTFRPLLNNCQPLEWSIGADSFMATNKKPTVSINPAYLDDKREDVIVQALYDRNLEPAQKTYINGLTLLARTQFTGKTQASPEPVKKNKSLKVRGVLQVANWDTDRYLGYRNQPVDVQFRTPGGKYRTVLTVNSGSNGVASATVKAKQTGYWRMAFIGNPVAAASHASGDRVKVN